MTSQGSSGCHFTCHQPYGHTMCLDTISKQPALTETTAPCSLSPQAYHHLPPALPVSVTNSQHKQVLAETTIEIGGGGVVGGGSDDGGELLTLCCPRRHTGEKPRRKAKSKGLLPSSSHLAPQGPFSSGLHPDPHSNLLTLPSAPGRNQKPFSLCAWGLRTRWNWTPAGGVRNVGVCYVIADLPVICCHFPSLVPSACLDEKLACL